MWQSCHLVQQPQERGRHLSKGSTGAHGNNRGVMSPLGRACVHEWLRRDTAPLNVTYTLSFIIVSRLWHCALGLSVWDDVDAARLWQLNDYSRGNLVPLHKKLWLFLTCLSENSVSQKLTVDDEMADVDQWYFSKEPPCQKSLFESNSLVKGISDQGWLNLLRNLPELSLTPNQTAVVFLSLLSWFPHFFFFPQQHP